MTELEREEVEATGSQLPVKLFQDSDLFDTGGDDSDSDEVDVRASKALKSPDRESPPPRMKGKKGQRSEGKARKKPPKLKKAEVQQIHSDTHRIIRESSVSLPKYEPKKKTIDSFLTKLRGRKPPARNQTVTHRETESALPRSNDVLTAPLDNSNPERSSQRDLSPSPGDTRLSPEGEVRQEHSDDVVDPELGGGHCEKLKPAAYPAVVPVDPARVPVDPAVVPVKPAVVPVKPAAIPVKPDAIPDAVPVKPDAIPVKPDAIPVKPAAISVKEAVVPVKPDAVPVKPDAIPVKEAVVPVKPDAVPVKPAAISVKSAAKTAAQRTITSLFAAKEPPKPEVVSEPLTQNPLPLPHLLPKLSSVNDFQVEGAPERELTGVELFQQRFLKHTTQPQAMSKKVKEEGEGDKSVPLVPEEVMTKLMSKPGAIRQHWRSALQQQLSQKRAEERREAEEYRKMYNEEVLYEEEEMTDGETTDAETSDEEFVQNVEAANAESDVCSDLDEDEGAGSEHQGVESGDEDRDLGSNNMEGQEGDRPGTFSDDEDVCPISRLTRKPRVLDSDDEDSDTSLTHVKSPLKSRLSQDTDQSIPSSHMNQHGDKPRAVFVKQVQDLVRRPSVLVDSEEASMGPLVFNESFDSEDSGSRVVQDCSESLREENDLTCEKADCDSERINATQDDSVLVRKLDTSVTVPMDSGVGASMKEDTRTQEVDDNLESSVLWDQVLPPAQPRRDNSFEIFPPTGKNRIQKTEKKLLDLPTEYSQSTFDPESQLEPAQRQPSVSASHSVQNSLDEDTQFLDADGFLCLRKEKKHGSPISAITGALDPSQEHSSSELLDLCSGKFVTQAEASSGRKRHASDSSNSQIVTQIEPWGGRQRHTSDSSNSQGVRELLGLPPVKLKPVGVSKLLASQSGLSLNSDDTQHPEMSEVIGLCSGVFPITQAASSFRPDNLSRSQASKQSAGTSDGMSEGSSDSEGESALLRWAKKQRNSGKPRDGHKQRDPGRDKGDLSDSEDEDMPVLARRRRFSKQRPKPTKEERLAEFVESEAELSGEDVGPDEEPFSGPDEYEDEAEGSDVQLSDSELWDQANRAHMKHTLADDKADLQEFKERFLKDGDLFEDGMVMKNGFFRTRRFARLGSEQGSIDLFMEEREVDCGDELEEASSQLEAQRRKDRLEREEFIRKCRERENTLLEFDEDSQSILGIIRDTTTSHSLMNTPISDNAEDVPRPSTTGCKRSRCGSFLRHNTATLRKLSSFTAASSSSLPSTGRGFVFQMNEAATPTTTNKPTKVNLSSSRSTSRPLAKKPKLDRFSSLPSESIFSMFK